MKYPLNIVKCIIGICILLYTPLLTYASSSSEEKHLSKKHTKCDKRGPKGKRGDRGHRGHRGHKGKRGDRGHRGHRGHKGKKGDRGHRGKRGDKGDTGEPGSEGPQGNPGIPGNNGTNGTNCTSFISTFGAWYNSAAQNITLPVTTPPRIVPFVNIEADGQGISNTGGAGQFVLSETGFYLVKVGVVVRTATIRDSFIFGLQLDGVTLPGGFFMGQPRDDPPPIDTAIVTISAESVMFFANAGQVLTLAYLGSVPTANIPAQIGPAQPIGPGFNPNPSNIALITIIQIE